MEARCRLARRLSLGPTLLASASIELSPLLMSRREGTPLTAPAAPDYTQALDTFCQPNDYSTGSSIE